MNVRKTYNLSDICRFVTSRTCNIENYISTENMLPNKGGITSPSNIPNGSAIAYQLGDVLISNIRPYFQKIWQANCDGACSADVLCIRANEKADCKYLYYLLSQQKFFDYVMSGAKGCKMPRGDKSQIMQWQISLPPLAEQKRIADILSAIDDKIELNRRINANLEQQAQALYKSWFVDFEPFGGKMPEDWRVGTLGDIIETIESGSRPKGGSETSGVPSIGAEKIERFGHYEYSGEKFINRDYFHKMKRGHVKNGDVLLYKDGAYTGKTSMVLDGFPYRECAVNEHVFILRTVASKYQFFLYCLMSYPDIRKMVYTLASAKAAQPGLNQTELLGVNIVVPSYNMIKKFNHFITPHMHQIAINALESSRLAQLRDTLLPKLMSGDITV